jgi:hypothetical protein
MFKKLSSLVLVGVLMCAACPRPVLADSQDDKQARFTEKVKRKIISLGVGEEARVRVKLRDNARLKGYISEVGEDYFVVTDTSAGTTIKVIYADVKEVEGRKLSTGAAIAIGVGIAVGIVALIGAIFGRSD